MHELANNYCIRHAALQVEVAESRRFVAALWSLEGLVHVAFVLCASYDIR